jgi:hypothetical protein
MQILLPKKGREWTNEEETEIARLRAVCGDGQHWTLECSHTDEGDPWCVVFNQPHHRVVLHIAHRPSLRGGRSLERILVEDDNESGGRRRDCAYLASPCILKLSERPRLHQVMHVCDDVEPPLQRSLRRGKPLSLCDRVSSARQKEVGDFAATRTCCPQRVDCATPFIDHRYRA